MIGTKRVHGNLNKPVFHVCVYRFIFMQQCWTSGWKEHVYLWRQLPQKFNKLSLYQFNLNSFLVLAPKRHNGRIHFQFQNFMLEHFTETRHNVFLTSANVCPLNASRSTCLHSKTWGGSYLIILPIWLFSFYIFNVLSFVKSSSVSFKKW